MTDNVKNPVYERAISLVQECLSSFPVVILGSGHSAEFGIPGMEKLSEYLLSQVPQSVSQQDMKTWDKFKEVVQRVPLETALKEVQLSQELMDLVIKGTWECIFPCDERLLKENFRNIMDLPLIRLYRYLFRSTHLRLSLVTTNYDRLAEYAADFAEYGWSTGFSHGYIGQRFQNHIFTFYMDKNPMRMIDIWKVHGSLDWFCGPDGMIYSLPSKSALSDGFKPIIVAPGIDKYRRTHEEPFRTTIAGADAAIAAGNSFLCIGYGFNDDHIQPKLLEKCRRDGKIIIVLVRKLTEAAKRELFNGRCRCFAAFEETPNGTRIFISECPDGVEFEGLKLWSLGQVLDKVL